MLIVVRYPFFCFIQISSLQTTPFCGKTERERGRLTVYESCKREFRLFFVAINDMVMVTSTHAMNLKNAVLEYSLSSSGERNDAN